VWQRAGRAARPMSTDYPRSPSSHVSARPPAPARRTRRRRVPTAARAPGFTRSRRRRNIRVCSDAHCRAGSAAPAPTTTLPSVVGFGGWCVARHRGTWGECASARTQKMHPGVGMTVCEPWHPTRREHDCHEDARRSQRLSRCGGRLTCRLGCRVLPGTERSSPEAGSSLPWAAYASSRSRTTSVPTRDRWYHTNTCSTSCTDSPRELSTPGVKWVYVSRAHLMVTGRSGRGEGAQGYVLLNSDDHANFLRKHKKDPALYRPDILHQVRGLSLRSGHPSGIRVLWL
jgi:hypothetical protein